MLLEGIGLWIPADVIHTEHNDKPKDEQDLGNYIGQLESIVLLSFHIIFNDSTLSGIYFCSVNKYYKFDELIFVFCCFQFTAALFYF